MDGQENINRIIHKESSKEKPKAESYKLLDKKNSEQLIEGSKWQTELPTPNRQQTKSEQHINRELSSYRLEKLRKNSEIDKFLEQLLIENIINLEYKPFHAKAVHLLGLEECRKIYLNVIGYPTPSKLYSFKVKGAMQLHYKQQYLSTETKVDSPHKQNKGLNN